MENKKLTIELTYDEWSSLQNYATDCGLTSTEIVENFVADLTGSLRSNGKDERVYAKQWLEHQFWWHFRDDLMNEDKL